MKKKNLKNLLFTSVLIDIFVVHVSLFFARSIQEKHFINLYEFIQLSKAFIPFTFFWIILLYIQGYYSLEKQRSRITQGIHIFIATLIVFLIGTTLFYVFEDISVIPRKILPMYCFLSFLFLSIMRHLTSLFYAKFTYKTIIGIIGKTSLIDELLAYENKHSYFNYKIKTIYDEHATSSTYNGIPVHKEFDAFINSLFLNNAIQVVYSHDVELSKPLNDVAFELLKENIFFISLEKFYESNIRKIALSQIDCMWFLKNISLNKNTIYMFIKRTIDIIISVIALIVFIVPLPLIALIIKLESPGPVFFTQIRTGYLGNNFKLIKLRTMKQENNDERPTIENDKRITRFGSFLRSTRIDELPQFLNVLIGNMNLIGPRPERPELIATLEKEVPFYRQRLLVKPGITGWDQVSGEYHSPSAEDTRKKLQNDFYYIKNISFELDFSIFAKTIKTVLLRKGV